MSRRPRYDFTAQEAADPRLRNLVLKSSIVGTSKLLNARGFCFFNIIVAPKVSCNKISRMCYCANVCAPHLSAAHLASISRGPGRNCMNKKMVSLFLLPFSGEPSQLHLFSLSEKTSQRKSNPISLTTRKISLASARA